MGQKATAPPQKRRQLYAGDGDKPRPGRLQQETPLGLIGKGLVKSGPMLNQDPLGKVRKSRQERTFHTAILLSYTLCTQSYIMFHILTKKVHFICTIMS